MDNKVKEKLIDFNQIYRSMDIVYHSYAKKIGLSDASFWILYCLTENNRSMTQRELCNEWSFAPQTINSSIKELGNRGIIVLENVPGNKKNKWLRLTDEGTILVSEKILPLIEAEGRAFSDLTDAECELMLNLSHKYSIALRQEVEKI